MPMVRLFTASILLGIFTACGAQVDVGGPAGSLSQGGGVSAGGSTASAGGTTSNSAGATGGSMSASTGHSNAIDLNTYCDGLLASLPVYELEQFVNVTSCDMAQRISKHGTNAQGWQSAIGSTVRDPS